MAEASIPVDLLNPGQVFACLGFLEAADILCGGAEGGFHWNPSANARFDLRVEGANNPFEAVLDFLTKATVSSLSSSSSENDTGKWQIETRRLSAGDPFPFPDPSSPATLPAELIVEGRPSIVIDHWGDDTERDNVKFWAGSGGYPGSAILRDALDLIRESAVGASSDPFSLCAPQSNSFRFDWRRDYIPMEIGFSLNDHADMTTVGFPLVEVLAAIGLTNARPQRISKLDYRYGVVSSSALLDPIVLRAALGCADLPFSQRRFRMRLGWPGQENQARCIVHVSEEIAS